MQDDVITTESNEKCHPHEEVQRAEAHSAGAEQIENHYELEALMLRRTAELEREVAERKRAEEILRENEERHRTILQAALDGFCLTDGPGNLLEVNDAYCRMTGYSAQELLRMSITDLEATENENEIAAHLRQIMIHGEHRFESRHRRKDGSVIDVEVVAQYRPREGGQFITLIRDISMRKRAETALRAERDRFSKIVGTAPGVICSFRRRPDGTDSFPYVSPAIQDVFGIRPEDLAQDASIMNTMIHPDHQEPLTNGIAESERTLSPWRDEFRFMHPEKGEIWIGAHSMPEREQDGGTIWHGFLTDITERKRAEQALRESEANLNQAQETARMGSWIDDLSGRISWSVGMYRIYGVSPSTFVPNDESFIKMVHPDDRMAMNEWLRSCNAGEKPGPLEFRTIFPDGSIHYYCGRGDLVCDAGGKPTHISGTVQDITEQKQAQIEKDKLQAQLNQAHKMESIGRLAGGVAHDFNNMLGVILVNVDLALNQLEDDHPLRAELEEIRKAANRSADLTRQLMAFARKQTVAPKVLDLNETVAGMLKMLQRLIGEDIRLDWRPNPSLWRVRMDPTQIDQILANLCINARDAINGAGTIMIKTDNVQGDEVYCTDHSGFAPGDYVRLEVADDGCGMDQATQDSIFEPFFTTKELGKGTGLGLATTYGIVRQNNGLIYIHSEIGLGTSFEILLPRHTPKPEEMRQERGTSPAPRGCETILLVEDEPSVLRMTSALLKKQGYEVLAAGSPGEAIRLAREHAGEIHLLITDVIMPEMNGRELAQSLLSHYPQLKHMFISGYTDDIIAHHGILDEGVHFVQKPFSVKDLTAKVREVLDTRQHTDMGDLH
jgi:PAS domain S-box-containing protein